MEIEIVTHFCKNDPTFMSDYHSQEVLVDGEQALLLQDAYHSSDESAKSFVAGIIYTTRAYGPDATFPVAVRERNVADIPDCE